MITALDELEEQPVLHESDQRRLNIHLIPFAAELDSPSDFEPRFFTPLERENLVVTTYGGPAY